jgi:hypothetical protein
MRSQAELERLFGGPDGVARIRQHVKASNDQMPPLTERQREVIRALFSFRTMPPRPEKQKADSSLESAAASR